MAQEELTFWGHLDVLRGYLIRIIVVTLACFVVAFGCKELLFEIVLAPSRHDFISYHLMHIDAFELQLVNIRLTEQFMIHMKTAFYFAVLVASPYIPVSYTHLTLPTICSV